MNEIQSLWPKDFPFIDLSLPNKHILLEEIKKRYQKYDPYYVTAWVLRKNREKIDKQWHWYNASGLADSTFHKEFQIHFHERAWEIWMWDYLNNTLFSLSSYGNKWPDFILNNSIYLECIAITKGSKFNKNGDSIWDYVPDIQFWIVQDVPIEKMLLRITSAVFEKGEIKYSGKDKIGWWKVKPWFKSSNPYIIAINTADLGFTLEIDDLLGPFFGIWNQAINMRTNESSHLFRPFITKENGEKISALIFETPEYENISAVILCDKYIQESIEVIQESLILLHNPFAKNKLDESLFNNIEQWKANDKDILKIS